MICFCLIIRFSVFFQCFLLSFLFPMCFYIFHLRKLLLALDTPIAIPVNLIFFLIQVRKIVFTIMEPINLLACLIYLILKLLFCIIHPLCYVFHLCDHWAHDFHVLFKLISLISPYVHCLIFHWSWQNVCEGTAAFDRYIASLVLQQNIDLDLECRFLFC